MSFLALACLCRKLAFSFGGSSRTYLLPTRVKGCFLLRLCKRNRSVPFPLIPLCARIRSKFAFRVGASSPHVKARQLPPFETLGTASSGHELATRAQKRKLEKIHILQRPLETEKSGQRRRTAFPGSNHLPKIGRDFSQLGPAPAPRPYLTKSSRKQPKSWQVEKLVNKSAN